MAGKTGPRKLLVASVGVATINYVLAGCDTFEGSGNLMPPPGGSFNSTAGAAGSGGKNTGGTPPTVANLPFPMGGNLMMGGNAGTHTGGAAEGGETGTAGQGGEAAAAGQGNLDGSGGAGGNP